MKFSKIILLLYVFVFSLELAQTPVDEIGQLRVIGTQLSDHKGMPIRLVGTSFGWNNWHSRFYTKGTVKWLKNDWNVNVVRAALGIDPEGAYLQNPKENYKNIETVVEAAIKEGVYVIIDWHTHKIHPDEAGTFFDKVSKKYGKYPNVIYEIFNEPEQQSWQEVKEYAEEIIRTIRKNDPHNLILVPSPEWDQRLDLVQKNPIKNVSNIMYTLHFYAGTHKKELRDLADAAINSGIPVFVSESAGMEATGDGKIDYREWQKYFDWMEKRKLSWITWSISDKKETCSMLLPTASSTGNWKQSDLNESGIKTREYLKQFNRRGEYIPTFQWKGRVEKTSNTTATLSGSASSVEFSFKGNSTGIKLKNNPHQNYYNYISVELDGIYIGRIKVDNNDFKLFTFEANKSTNIHDIKIFKATEAAMGEVIVDVSEIEALPSPALAKKKIEFIGNSITCGFGNDETALPCGQGQWFDQHNAYLAYGPVVSRMLGTNFLLSSVSGYGIYRNWNSEPEEENTLPEVYPYLYLRKDNPEKFENDYQPDLVSICLGTNDLSLGDGTKQRSPFDRGRFVLEYIEFIQNIYKLYPNTRIALLNSPMVGGERNKLFVECLREIKSFFINDKLHPPVEIFEFPEMKTEGCGHHPSASDHKKMAELLFPFYEKLLKN
ncbi:cellulase family glycosylhydrolase [Chryseobacterium sp. SC28]|uniref:cellulase family glycosylhydrolase n=1 Tax=Chryseobacterium sp. SC28 TaxID=2268028 RepID=UPI000F651CAB|nr:cellulase family glycosylhydrolase [Chryseobacterium sp. SC28]RRQ47231.1 hypothetical protein DTW91_00665 [Chryseobacterium sp. SC28]